MRRIFTIVGFMAVIAKGFGQPAALPSVNSDWPGVVFQIAELRRFSGDYLLMVVHVKFDSKTEESFLLAEPPKAGTVEVPEDADENTINLGDYRPRAFSLVPTTIKDEAAGKKYEALSHVPAGVPFVGPEKMVAKLVSGDAVQMAVCFQIPPPANPETPQTVSVQFPRTSKLLTGVAIPSQ